MTMTLTELLEKYAKPCIHFTRNASPPYEYKRTCFSCAYNVVRQKPELTRNQRREFLSID